MTTSKSSELSLLAWKPILLITMESLLTFYLATFCIGMFYTHRGTDWLLSAIILSMLYVFVIIACAKRLIQTLPLPALMLIIPLAPLIVIIMVLSLIPILQLF